MELFKRVQNWVFPTRWLVKPTSTRSSAELEEDNAYITLVTVGWDVLRRAASSLNDENQFYK